MTFTITVLSETARLHEDVYIFKTCSSIVVKSGFYWKTGGVKKSGYRGYHPSPSLWLRVVIKNSSLWGKELNSNLINNRRLRALLIDPTEALKYPETQPRPKKASRFSQGKTGRGIKSDSHVVGNPKDAGAEPHNCLVSAIGLLNEDLKWHLQNAVNVNPVSRNLSWLSSIYRHHFGHLWWKTCSFWMDKR